jgi:uncharacterized SAM-dependent methyltransferase
MVNAESKVKINDLIFKELIKRGYSLEGNTRVWNIADSKLWYLTPEQAQGYLDLDSDNKYKKAIGQAEAENLIEINIKEIKEKIGNGPINVVDLGCGDGNEAAQFVRELKKSAPNIKIRYCPIDISGYMVEKAIETFSKLGVDEIVEFQYNISDFENLENVTPLLRRGEYKKNVFLLLGNTLGNFEINELLYEIRTSMEKEDVLIVDAAIDDKRQEERVKIYQKSDKFDNFLVHIPLQLGLGRNDVVWGTRWKNQRIEFYYTINKDKIINFQGKILQFNKGDQIIVAIAYKLNKDDLLHIFNIHFDDVLFKISEDSSKGVIICKK